MVFSRSSGARPGAPILVLVGFCNTFYLMQVSTYLQPCAITAGRVMSLYRSAGILLGACSRRTRRSSDARFAVLFGGIMVTANALVLIHQSASVHHLVSDSLAPEGELRTNDNHHH